MQRLSNAEIVYFSNYSEALNLQKFDIGSTDTKKSRAERDSF